MKRKKFYQLDGVWRAYQRRNRSFVPGIGT